MIMDYAFIHGGGQGSWVWQQAMATLDRQTEGKAGCAFALDVPGCGTKRGRATDDLTLPDVAQELISDIKAAGMKDVVLIGHSQGGQAMALMAQMQPGLFRCFIHVSCSIPLPGQTVMQMMGKGAHGSNPNEVGWPAGTEAQDIAGRQRQLFCNDMNGELATAFLAKLDKDMWPRQTYAFTDWCYEPLDAVPSTYVVCLRDRILPVKWQEMFAERFRSGRIVRIDAGHQAMTTRPQALAEIISHEAARAAAES
jgi:pimeloyl-ACP methyl ester carboxylesterase